ncbi:MAG: DUF1501 domain-containing protein [Anaerolineae bacterium]
MSVFDRRAFLKTSLQSGLLAITGLSLPTWMPRLAFGAPEQSPRGDTLVVIFMRGAADGMNIVVPYSAAEYHSSRTRIGLDEPNKGTSTSVIDLGAVEGRNPVAFGFNPVLTKMKELWDERALAVVHAVGSPDPTHSHFDAMDYMERGTPGEKQIPTGWLARHLASVASVNNSPFRAVGMGGTVQAALRGPIPATALQSIATYHLNGNTQEIAKIQATLAALYQGTGSIEQQGQDTFEAMGILKRIASGGAYKPANGAQYPTTGYGQALQTVAQLIKSDVGLEVACVDIGGWDTHAGEGDATPAGNNLPGLLDQLQNGLHAFYSDLGDRMNQTLVVTMSEFGRRLADNASNGTDHGHGNVMFLLGGGVNGGKVYTDWPGLAPNQLYGPGDLAITTDFRDVLGEVVRLRLGNNRLDQVFPSYATFKTLNILKPRSVQLQAALPQIVVAAR